MAGIDMAGIGVRQVIDMPFTKIIDEVDDGGLTTYVGMASPGNSGTASKALPIWQIQKISKSGYVTTISYADGNLLFDNIWDNRATTVSYS